MPVGWAVRGIIGGAGGGNNPFINYTVIQGGSGVSVATTLPTPRTTGNLLLAWTETIASNAPTLFFKAGAGATGNVSTTSLTPTLPSGAVGDVAIAFVSVYAASITIGASAGWTIPAGATVSDANMCSAWAYRQLTGTDSSCTFSWTGAQSAHCDCAVITGTGGVPANVGSNNGSSSTATKTALTLSASNNLVLGIVTAKGSTTSIGPAGGGYAGPFSFFQDAVGSSTFIIERATGSSSDAVSCALTASLPWHAFLIEIPYSSTSIGGWTLGGTVWNQTSSAWAWRYVDGGEASPTFYFPVGGYHTRCAQITGIVASNPIGATNSATANSNTTITAAALTLASSKSVALGLLLASGSNIPGTPAPYTPVGSYGDANGSDNLVYEWLISRSNSDAISQAIASCNWNTHGIEIKMQ